MISNKKWWWRDDVFHWKKLTLTTKWVLNATNVVKNNNKVWIIVFIIFGFMIIKIWVWTEYAVVWICSWEDGGVVLQLMYLIYNNCRTWTFCFTIKNRLQTLFALFRTSSTRIRLYRLEVAYMIIYSQYNIKFIWCNFSIYASISCFWLHLVASQKLMQTGILA